MQKHLCVEQTHTTHTDSNGSGQAVHEDKVATHSGSAVLATLTILTITEVTTEDDDDDDDDDSEDLCVAEVSGCATTHDNARNKHCR